MKGPLGYPLPCLEAGLWAADVTDSSPSLGQVWFSLVELASS